MDLRWVAREVAAPDPAGAAGLVEAPDPAVDQDQEVVDRDPVEVCRGLAEDSAVARVPAAEESRDPVADRAGAG